ncbi:MAG: PP2C family serine/threonine-protein phosphatase [Termitinemataceae bacterium]|nr:MAG: PP2C family serine/threonine-protein phosphatase [Termitinemataceae bacterium]
MVEKVNVRNNFYAFGESCVGESHLKTGKPCQDYSAHFSTDNFAIVIVADGHGSDAHFRSDRGSRFAVEVTMQNIQNILKGNTNNDISHIQNEVLPHLIKKIVQDWNGKVEEDWNNDTPEINNDNYKMMMWPPRVYGTTLIAVVITTDYWAGIQIGDGKCVVLDYDDESCNFSQPIPWDDDCYMNVTTSLCEIDAADRFRIFASSEIPRAIFLGTDGVDDSYPVHENEKHLAALYGVIYKNFMQKSFDEGLKQLQEFLPVLTKKGSGDDVSIAGILVKV